MERLFIAEIIKKIPVEGVADPGAQGRGDLAGLQKHRQGNGQGGLKRENGHHPCKDPQGNAE